MLQNTPYLSDKYDFLRLNPDYKYDDQRRQERNQAILMKIQEVKVKASIFAEKSEKYRQMKNEYYKVLLQKYHPQLEGMHTINRGKFPDDPNPDVEIGKGNPTMHVSKHWSDTETNFPKIYASIGVNTELTGPVRPVKVYDNFADSSFGEKAFDVPMPKRIPVSKEVRFTRNDTFGSGIKPDEVEVRTDNPWQKQDELLKSKLRRLEISTSSTSESLETTLDDGEARPKSSPRTAAVQAIEQLLTDDTSFDTTTSAVLSRKPEEDASMDRSLSKSNFSGKNTNFTLGNPEWAENVSASIFEESVLQENKDSEVIPLVNINERAPYPPSNESLTTSAGDSVMDSICNKMPEPIPTDGNESISIAHIVEEEEIEKNDTDSEKENNKSFDESRDAEVLQKPNCQNSEENETENLNNEISFEEVDPDPDIHKDELEYGNHKILHGQKDAITRNPDDNDKPEAENLIQGKTNITKVENPNKLETGKSSPIPNKSPTKTVKGRTLKVDYEDTESETSPKPKIKAAHDASEVSDDLDDFFDI